MTTIDSQLSLWDRISSWLTRVAEIADYDSAQFTLERINELDKELTQLKTRIEQLEKEPATGSNFSTTEAAA
jgi:predicted  nucleic acid-binding Zn-ribbon protein